MIGELGNYPDWRNRGPSGSQLSRPFQIGETDLCVRESLQYWRVRDNSGLAKNEPFRIGIFETLEDRLFQKIFRLVK